MEQTLAARFEALVAAVRVECARHGMRAVELVADASRHTIFAHRKKDGPGQSSCSKTFATDELMVGNLQQMAKEFVSRMAGPDA